MTKMPDCPADQIKPFYDAIIIGAGPAGMAAALQLRALDLQVAVLDEQERPGGQIYRGVAQRVASPDGVAAAQGRRTSSGAHAAAHGARLIRSFLAAGADYFARSLVWSIDHTGAIVVRQGQHSVRTGCCYLLIATGAQERPVAFEGWQLPGVLGVGAAQIMLKTANAVPDHPPVLFGSGPLLYLYACQCLEAGQRPLALLDTTTSEHRRASLRHLPQAISAPAYLLRGLALMARIRAARVPVYRQVESLVAIGQEHLERVEFKSRGQQHELITNCLLSHHGVIPETRLLQTLGIQCSWDALGHYWRPQLDEWGQASIENIFVAGDGAGIGGALSAEYAARITALEIAHRLQRISRAERDKAAREWRRALQRDLRVRAFIEARYRVPATLLRPTPATLVCRCESVTATAITAAIELGCAGPNQLKAFTRCGMGACQGRMCGPTIEAIMASELQCSPEQIGRFRARTPVRPVSLAQLASVAADASAE